MKKSKSEKSKQEYKSLDKNKKIQVWKRTLLFFIPFFIFILALSSITLALHKKFEMNNFKEVETRLINTPIQIIKQDFTDISSDLLTLTNQSEIRRLFDSQGNINKEILDRLAMDYKMMSGFKSKYDQIRLLDENGMEIIRINLNGGNPAIVEKENLQNKGKRYYFYDAFKLEKNQVFISPLDLNIENGEIEKPLKPMIRIGTPIFDGNNKKRGIALLNFLGDSLIQNIRENVNIVNINELMILNSDGYWLYSPNPDEEWGFMYENKKDVSFKNRSPEEWKTINSANSGQFETESGLFTFETVFPLLEGQISTTGSGEAYQSSSEELDREEYYWKIVSFIPAENLQKHYNKRKIDAVILLFIFSILGFIAFFKIYINYVYKRINNKKIIESEQKLRESNIIKDKFFTIIAHDLKSPFTVLLGFSEMLSTNLDNYDKAKQKDFIDLIYTHTKHTHKLLDNLLAWSRLQRDKISFHPDNLDLLNIANEAFALASARAEKKKVNLVNKINKDIIIYADNMMLSTTIRNIVVNAIKFTPEYGSVTIDCKTITDEKMNEYYQISISDTGIGIPEKNIPNLFDITKNTSTLGTNNEKGTGLGLILCKEFIDKHNGNIVVESEESKGTTFLISIPIIGK